MPVGTRDKDINRDDFTGRGMMPVILQWCWKLSVIVRLQDRENDRDETSGWGYPNQNWLCIICNVVKEVLGEDWLTKMNGSGLVSSLANDVLMAERKKKQDCIRVRIIFGRINFHAATGTGATNRRRCLAFIAAETNKKKIYTAKSK